MKTNEEPLFSAIAPPVFNGLNYHMWAVRMEAYLDANDLSEAVEEDYEIPPLAEHPTVAQLRSHRERRQRKSKAKSCLFSAVSPAIFTRIMTLKIAKEIWDYLKQQYEGDKMIKGMQMLNLIREFEMQKMKESETVQEYSDKLLGIANKVRLLGGEFDDSRIVQKLLVTVPERFETTISALENSKDLSIITLAELLSALQAQEQRRHMRQEESIESGLQAKVQVNQGQKEKKKGKKEDGSGKKEGDNKKRDFPPCEHCGKKGHPPFKCWRRPDVKCNKCKQLGDIAKICKSKTEQVTEVQVEDQTEEHLFTAQCFSVTTSIEIWLIDSGCTSHMTSNQELFLDLEEVAGITTKIGSGDKMKVKGKGTIALQTTSGIKKISCLLYS